MEIWRWAWLVLAGLVAPAAAQSVSIPAEYDKLIQSRTVIGTLGPDLFGDQVNFYDGTLQFRQTDVSLAGNSAIGVSVGRRFTVKQDYGKQGAFGDWDWDIPHLHGIFSTQGWIVSLSAGQPASAAQLRCSQYGPPPPVSGIGGGTFSAGEFWNGSFLTLPGGGGGELLIRSPSTSTPVDGFSYPLITKDGIALRCLPSLAATSTGSGEGFEAVTPDGTRYRFDHMVMRSYPQLTKGSPAPELLMAANNAGAMRAPINYLMNRREVWILPTLATDRFGNTVSYAWNASEPWKLNSITASDGRSLTFGYVLGTNRVATISEGTRTWSYEYQSVYLGARLSAVVQPDGSRWTFELEPLRTMMALNDTAMCGEAGHTYTPTGTGTITHPSGAVGSFTVTEKVHGRSQVPLQCNNYDPAGGTTGYSVYPAEFLTPSLSSKTLSGPGVPSQSWTYSYGPANNCYLPGGPWPLVGTRCAANTPGTRTVTVSGPDGAVTRYTFGNRYLVDEGQLLKVEEGVSGGTALRTTTTAYALPSDGPYPNPVGLSLQPRNDGYLSSRHTPKRLRVVTQQGNTFKWQVDNTCAGATYCFDSRARPTKIIKSSSPAP